MLVWHDEALNQNLNPIIRGAVLHTKFVRIHPFIDGNGGTARLLLNTELLKAGYPMAIIKKMIGQSIMRL
nr:Fic family protein [Campylobacter mucosalis]